MLHAILGSAIFPKIGLVVTVVVVSNIFLAHILSIATNHVPSDPFATYLMILPGRSLAALNDFDCHLATKRVNGQLDDGRRASCALFPKDEAFDIIHIDTLGGRIIQVIFYTHEIQVGEIMLRWGQYGTRRTPSGITWLRWEYENYFIETTAEPFHYHDRVRMIVFSLNPES
ncbi:MAG: hypothetical protein R3E39_21055 [Anaerolineae bacterium]